MTQFVQSNFLYMCRPIILFESCKQIDYWIMHAGEYEMDNTLNSSTHNRPYEKGLKKTTLGIR